MAHPACVSRNFAATSGSTGLCCHCRGLLVNSWMAVQPISHPFVRLFAMPPAVGMWAPKSLKVCSPLVCSDGPNRLFCSDVLQGVLESHQEATIIDDLQIILMIDKESQPRLPCSFDLITRSCIQYLPYDLISVHFSFLILPATKARSFDRCASGFASMIHCITAARLSPNEVANNCM